MMVGKSGTSKTGTTHHYYSSVKQRLDDLEDKKADLEIVIAKEKIEKTTLTKEQIVFWISRFKNGNPNNPIYRRSLVDIFANSIFLYKDRIVITFNWKDDTKTITLAEFEHAFSESDKTANILNIEGFECSHLDDNRPPLGTNANPYQCFFVGETFAFVFPIEYPNFNQKQNQL